MDELPGRCGPAHVALALAALWGRCTTRQECGVIQRSCVHLRGGLGWARDEANSIRRMLALPCSLSTRIPTVKGKPKLQ